MARGLTVPERQSPSALSGPGRTAAILESPRTLRQVLECGAAAPLFRSWQ